MSDTRRLKGRRIAVLAADGFEKLELTIPIKALKLAGADVDVISLRRGRIRGMNLHEPAGRVHVDRTVEEARPADYDALFIPGGFISPDLLRQSADARDLVRVFDATNKPIATLCHGPWVLASAGMLQNRTLTSWPGIRDDLVNAGATWLDEPVVTNGNLLTSRGPQDLAPFVRALVDFIEAGGHARGRVPAGTISAPQRDLPPGAVVKAMQWLPRPSLRGVFGTVGTVAAVVGLGAAARYLARSAAS
ncbi:MAG TPA: type 1 glutamine amidotransferase domain-containing protein [Kofleriaceae bacterium]|nr:type 1 glutamine amidotransferase domain-containing protein [Kofleriaceae bacterium]